METNLLIKYIIIIVNFRPEMSYKEFTNQETSDPFKKHVKLFF